MPYFASAILKASCSNSLQRVASTGTGKCFGGLVFGCRSAEELLVFEGSDGGVFIDGSKADEDVEEGTEFVSVEEGC